MTAPQALHAQMRACRRCLEAGYPITPGAVFSGPSTARVMVVGQAPGVTEAEAGRPFNGPSGRRLFRWLAEAGWDETTFRATQYMTAVTKCYPGKARGGKGDRVPTRAEQKLCTPFLEEELRLVQPALIIPVGGLAVRRFLGPVRLAEVVGTRLQDPEGRWIVPLPHPSGASLWLNRPENRERVGRAIDHLRRLRRELGV
ncbi:MAG TPA: uracil-DNA glycosylase [Thermoflexia bacterium]|nr:uracil-DNA glycosylase [Thermoflexia bacterium]